MLRPELRVISLTELGNYLDSVINNFYGASRLLLLPAITGMSKVNCELLSNFCCDNGLLTINYKIIGKVAIVRAVLGSITKNEVPCVVNARRMTPLARFVKSGIISVKGNFLIINDWGDYLKILGSSEEAPLLLELLNALKYCDAYTVNSLSRCVKIDESEVFKALITLRMLYPALIEVIPNDLTINSILKKLGIGKSLDISELFNILMANNVDDTVIMPNNLLKALNPNLNVTHRLRNHLPRKRTINGDVIVVRSSNSRYSIPSILNMVDFNNAIVADIGCGFGIKGTYGLRLGASFVILIDVDESILKLRHSGGVTDRVVADARRLPLRDSSVNVAIFWNVINFIREKELAINEAKRICKRDIVFSVYNAVNAYWNYSYEEFVTEVLRLGRPITIRRISNTQFQAIVRVNYDKD